MGLTMDLKLKRRISILGFLMTLVIAVYHCGNGEAPPINGFDARLNGICSNFFDKIAGIAMSYFFTTTGFLLFHKFDMHDYVSKIKRRVYSLLIPYLLWQLIYCFRPLLSGNVDIKHLFNTTFLMEMWPPNGPQWYLYAVFILALASPVFYFFLKDSRTGAVMCFLMVVLAFKLSTVTNPVFHPFTKYGYMGNILNYLPSYFFGLYFGLHESRQTKEKSLTYCLLILCGSFVVDCIWGGFSSRIVIRLLPILMLYLWPVTEKPSNLKLINLSFLIYSLHNYVDSNFTDKIRKLLLIITPSAFIENFMGRVLSLVLILLLSFIVWIALSMICPKLLELLTGGRVKPYLKNK